MNVSQLMWNSILEESFLESGEWKSKGNGGMVILVFRLKRQDCIPNLLGSISTRNFGCMLWCSYGYKRIHSSGHWSGQEQGSITVAKPEVKGQGQRSLTSTTRGQFTVTFQGQRIKLSMCAAKLMGLFKKCLSTQEKKQNVCMS